MKRIIAFSLVAASMLSSVTLMAQDKSKRPSPPAMVTQTTASGATITIDYSKPSLKGRKVGSDVAAFGKVWRTGANEATTFEVSKDVKVNGKALPAGKYSLYTIPGEKEWTIILNKAWKQWGTVYNESEDALRIMVNPVMVAEQTEQLTFSVNVEGVVSLMWGNTAVTFNVM